jgi:hypothetical protein
MRHLRPGGEPDTAAGPRLILGEPFEYRAGAADMLVLEEAVGPAADDFGNWLERRLRGEPRRHDCRYVAAGSGQGLRQVRERPFQAKAHGAVVGRRQFVGRIHQRRGEDHAGRKPANAGDHIPCQHWLFVVEAKPLAQLEGPAQPIVVCGMALDHLRLRLPLGVDAVQRIEDEIGGISRRPRAGDHRVEHGEIGHPRENQGFRPIRAPPEPRGHSGGERRGGGGLKQIPSSHGGSPDFAKRPGECLNRAALCCEHRTAGGLQAQPKIAPFPVLSNG